MNVWTSIYILRMEGTGTPSCGAFPKGDQIGLRIWRAGKVDGRCINHVMVCFVFATLGDVAMMGSRVGEITHSLLLFNALTQMEKKNKTFLTKLTYRSRIRSSGTKKPQVVTFFSPIVQEIVRRDAKRKL